MKGPFGRTADALQTVSEITTMLAKNSKLLADIVDGLEARVRTLEKRMAELEESE